VVVLEAEDPRRTAEDVRLEPASGDAVSTSKGQRRRSSGANPNSGNVALGMEAFPEPETEIGRPRNLPVSASVPTRVWAGTSLCR
jgi:hypothetical protein